MEALISIPTRPNRHIQNIPPNNSRIHSSSVHGIFSRIAHMLRNKSINLKRLNGNYRLQVTLMCQCRFTDVDIREAVECGARGGYFLLSFDVNLKLL